jgi:hypothetical protein
MNLLRAKTDEICGANNLLRTKINVLSGANKSTQSENK